MRVLWVAERNRFTGSYFSKNICLLRGRALGTRVIVKKICVCNDARGDVNTKLR